MGVASASLARVSLAALPAGAAAALDLPATAAMLACFVTAKSAEARAEAAAMSRCLAEARGLADWAAAVRAECKPAVARGLLAGLAVAPEAEADGPAAVGEAGLPSALAAAGGAYAAAGGPMSPGRAGCCGLAALVAAAGSPAAGRVPSLAQYLRERSSQRRRRGGLPEGAGAEGAGCIGGTPLAMGPFSPSVLGAGRRGRMSKSPVLVLKREQMLAAELCAAAGVGAGARAGGAEPLVEVEGDGC